MIQKPKGTLDILPDETPLWHEIEDTVRNVTSKYGFSEIIERSICSIISVFVIFNPCSLTSSNPCSCFIKKLIFSILSGDTYPVKS